MSARPMRWGGLDARHAARASREYPRRSQRIRCSPIRRECGQLLELNAKGLDCREALCTCPDTP
jgi:hypothetical protein